MTADVEWKLRTEHVVAIGPPTFAYARQHGDFQGKCSCRAFWVRNSAEEVLASWREHVYVRDFHRNRSTYPADELEAVVLLWDRINGTGAQVRAALKDL